MTRVKKDKVILYLPLITSNRHGMEESNPNKKTWKDRKI